MQPEEVFRFVASRAPRPRRPRLDLGLVADVTPFMRTLLNDLRAPDAHERAVATVDAFLASADFSDDPSQRSLLDRLDRFHLRFRRTPPAAAAAAEALVAEIFNRSSAALVEDPAFAEAERDARDAILALKLRSVNRPGLLGRYTRILQSAAFIRRLATAPDDIDFGRAVSSLTLPISIPTAFRAFPTVAAQPDETPDTGARTPPQGSDVEGRLATLDRTLLELTAGASGLVRRSDDAAAGAPALVLSRPMRARLSDATRGVLDEERIDLATAAFTDVLDALNGRRAALIATLSEEPDSADDDEPVRAIIGSTVLPSTSASPAIPMDPNFLDPSTQPPTTIGPLRPTGVGQLLIVRQQIKRYEASEVSHVENVLRSESRSRGTRRLRRTEETFLVEEETTSEEERDLQTTERIGVQSEIQKTLANARQFNVGVSVSAGYGPFVQVEASTEFETSSSSQTAESNATEFAREMTERTASRVSQRVRTQQTRATLEEFEENITHGFDNTNGETHAVGIYQWLDRVYEMQVYDYGIRLLFQFTLLEPAALYLNALEAQIAKPAGLRPPKKLTIRPNQLGSGNYQRYVSRYRAEDVEPPPPEWRAVAHTFSHSSPDGSRVEHAAEALLVVPEGYRAFEVRAAIMIDSPSSPALPPGFGTGSDSGEAFDPGEPVNRVDILVAHQRVFKRQESDNGQTEVTEDRVDTLDLPEGEVAVAVNALNILSYAATVTITCVRTERGFAKWQQDTYAALARAFAARKAEYEEQLATLAAAQGVTPEGRNPTMNRIIERNEIKRLATMMLSGQRFKSTAVPLSPQAAEFDFDRMLRAGQYAEFWNKVIDWGNLDYELLPYFWARQSTWGRMLTEGADPIHAQFIAAGAATVRLAVTPGMEAAMLHFLETGEIWTSGELPTVTRDDFVAFLDEIEARRPDPVDPTAAPLGGGPPEEIAVGPSWEIRLPTTLVRLRPDASLPEWVRDEEGNWSPVDAANS